MKTVVFDAQLKVLSHFVTVENLARAQSDVLLAAQGPSGTLCGGGNLFQLLLGSGQQSGSLAGTLFCQQWIEAGDESLAGKIGMSDLDQIRLVEKRHLQPPIAGQLLNLSGAQSGDPFDAVRKGQVLADAGAGDHAAVSDEHNLPEAEALPQFIHLRGHCFGIGSVAAENFDGDGTPACVGEETKNDLRITGFIVAGVAEFRQWTVTAFEVSRGQVVENYSSIPKLAFGQFLLDAGLPFQQPVHGGVKLGFVNGVQCEQLAETAVKSIGVKAAGGGEFGGGIEDAGDDHRDDEIALTAGLRIDNGIEL